MKNHQCNICEKQFNTLLFCMIHMTIKHYQKGYILQTMKYILECILNLLLSILTSPFVSIYFLAKIGVILINTLSDILFYILYEICYVCKLYMVQEALRDTKILFHGNIEKIKK